MEDNLATAPYHHIVKGEMELFDLLEVGFQSIGIFPKPKLVGLVGKEPRHAEGLLFFVVALLTDHEYRGRHEDSDGEHHHQPSRPEEDGPLELDMPTRVAHRASVSQRLPTD
jgi:hypothetical protein